MNMEKRRRRDVSRYRPSVGTVEEDLAISFGQ